MKNISVTFEGLVAENGYIIKDGKTVLRYTTRRDHTILTEENQFECRCTYHIIMKNGHKMPGHPFYSILELLKFVHNNPTLI